MRLAEAFKLGAEVDVGIEASSGAIGVGLGFKLGDLMLEGDQWFFEIKFSDGIACRLAHVSFFRAGQGSLPATGCYRLVLT